MNTKGSSKLIASVKTGNWQQHGENIRYREVRFYDWNGELCREFEFNVFKRPYVFGLIGKKRWIWSITANDFGVGLGFTALSIRNVAF